MPEQAAGSLAKSNRKREREDVIGMGKVDDATIEGVLNNIKNRVLNGETLNNFKKDINQLVDIIEKKDPLMERLPDIVGAQLAKILQKPEQEM